MNTNRPANFKPLPASRQARDQNLRAFTLTELLVVVVTLGILAMLLLPALANTRPQSKAFQCLNNMRQMATAWTLYAEDNHDNLAINSDPHVKGTTLFPAVGGGQSWITGSMDWSTGQQNTNESYLVDDKHSLLGSYLARQVKVFACPAANYVSPPERSLGWGHRSRSIAMNGAVGDGDKFAEPNKPFGWTQWYFAKKATDFHTPGPSEVWVFSDEHPDSVDDALMYTSSYAVTSFTELPGSQHGGACGLAFADGHSEIHKWSGPIANQPVKYQTQQQVACSITDPDMLWLAKHTPQD